jgi:uncharacterized protein
VSNLLCERGADVNAVAPGKSPSLAYAVGEGHLQIVKKLIDHGADVNALVEQEVRVLNFAALKGHSEVVTALLQAGAECGAELQLLCFTCACIALSDTAAAEVARPLLPYCTSVSLNEADPVSGDTALSYALEHGKLQVARALHAAGADVHCKTEQGTAVHSAVLSGSLAAVKWVQSVGVDPRAANGDGKMPLHCACKHNHTHIIKYLLGRKGAAEDVHACTVHQQTPLHYAVAGGAADVVQLLLDCGAHIDARDAAGGTPLMYASTAAVVELLLAAAADAAAVGDGGGTTLHLQASIGACARSICLLLKAGADPTALDRDGSTPAHRAGIHGHFALEALLSHAADDYRKKHPTARGAADTASSGNSSSSGSSASGSSVVTQTAATTSVTDSSSSSSNSGASAGRSVMSDSTADTAAASDNAASSAADADTVAALAAAVANVSLEIESPVPATTQQQ